MIWVVILLLDLKLGMEQLFISAYLLQKRQTPKLYLIKYVRESIYDKPKPKKDSVC